MTADERRILRERIDRARREQIGRARGAHLAEGKVDLRLVARKTRRRHVSGIAKL